MTPLDSLPADAALVAAVFLLAGLVKGVVGLGLPTVSVGLLALLMTPAEAASLLLLPSLLTNIAQASGPALKPLLRRLWPMLLAIVPGALAGSAVIAAGSAALPVLGLALLAYAAWGLASGEQAQKGTQEGEQTIFVFGHGAWSLARMTFVTIAKTPDFTLLAVFVGDLQWRRVAEEAEQAGGDAVSADIGDADEVALSHRGDF